MNPKITRKLTAVYIPFMALIAILVVFLSQIQFAEAQQTYPGYTIFSTSPNLSTIPANSVYTRETRIGSFRPGYQEWGCPVYRVPANEVNPLVTITNTYSGRVESWPIPTYAVPAPEADGHMCIVNLNTNTVYEFFEMVWTGSRTVSAGGMVAFPMNGQGISDPPHRRVTASGFANMYGMIKREDFINPATGQLDPNNAVVRHALTMNLPPAIINSSYVAPAIGGETAGSAGTNGIPMGARFALPRDLNVDALNVHPIVKVILRAARDYGMYIADGTGTANYNGNYTGTIEMEPQLLATLYGGSSNDDYLNTIQSQVYNVISQYGIYRVTAGTGPVPTNTAVPTSRPTDIGGGQEATPTFTSTPRPTNTVVPPTSTPRPTNTPTLRPTNTTVPPTSTARPTNTVVPPTSTARPTNTVTPRPPTSTPRPTNTVTPRPPTSTPRPSSTPRPTSTSTPRPATSTPRPTDVGGGQEATPTFTATVRPTNTPVPPTSTPRPTSTSVPPTSTPVPSSTPVPAGIAARIVMNTSGIRIGSTFNMSIVLDNPSQGAGGGVDAFEVTCQASGRVTGQSITNGTVFGPNPVVVTQSNYSGDWMRHAVSQSGSNPPVVVGGTVVTVRLRANTSGSSTITCSAEVITANGTSVTLNVAPVTFSITR